MTAASLQRFKKRNLEFSFLLNQTEEEKEDATSPIGNDSTVFQFHFEFWLFLFNPLPSPLPPPLSPLKIDVVCKIRLKRDKL